MDVVTPLAVTPTTWNPSDLSNVALSNANLTAMVTAAFGGVRSIFQIPAGVKVYWEITITNPNNGNLHGVSPQNTAIYGLTTTANTFFINDSGSAYANGTFFASFGTIAAGSVLCLAFDTGANLGWARVGAGGQWNNSGTANPATGTGGQSIGATLSNRCAHYVGGSGASGNCTANFGATAFTGAVPAGFNAGLGAPTGPPAATTNWNPADLSGNVTLSLGNLRANASNGSVRSVFSASTGKYYWEYSLINPGTGDTYPTGPQIGLGNTTTALGNIQGSGAGCLIIYTYQVYNNGSIGITLVHGGAVQTLCMAIDLGAKLAWMQIIGDGTAYGWNTGGANPATGTGGLDITAIMTAPIAAAWGTANASQTTMNSGASGFVGSVPAGFTPGFGAGPFATAAAMQRAVVLA